MGRNNWLFAGSERGGHAAAILYSLIASAKRHGLDPFAYLRDLLEMVPTLSHKRIGLLFPDKWKTLQAAPIADNWKIQQAGLISGNPSAPDTNTSRSTPHRPHPRPAPHPNPIADRSDQSVKCLKRAPAPAAAPISCADTTEGNNPTVPRATVCPTQAASRKMGLPDGYVHVARPEVGKRAIVILGQDPTQTFRRRRER